ncbi:DUF368 domain-containing protein [Fuerstiella marisgermanici]|uniref:DUF368 domain-containing protein n=1 Tax=Fuerstiella marisgermanici TaxID=1891926 RepID=A0A1P8WSE9_9PLAN|nr:DUF368 domain-containing protein [Fuerstiella marisgermanici]APZ96970.1 hypothetical protein Fuma_06646 [Fuerstiella marisgermanici]
MTDGTSELQAAPPSPEPVVAPIGVSLRTAVCGFLMGAADIVPGVSGGTVALILGIYERLVTAISRCDATFLKLLSQRQLRQAANHIDLKFVVPLGLGIATGIGGLASLMNYLLNNQMSLTFAAFSGMILASSLLVAKRIPRWRMEHVGVLIAGILIALRIVTLEALRNPPDTLGYMFVCGMIGITAMILPGISGAFILLLLGQYHDITDRIKGLVHGEISVEVIVSLGVFAAGCLTGLLGFSRVLRWLLLKYHDATMAVLCGFMLGSLYKLWPFQADTTKDVVKFKHKVFEHFVPREFSIDVVLAIVLCLAGIGVVLLLDMVAVNGQQESA